MSRVICKGNDAAEFLMSEIDNLFRITADQRESILSVIDKATDDESEEWNYEKFYIEAGLCECEIAGQPIESENYTGSDGNPEGGWVEAPGIAIRWQNGPLDPDDEEGKPWNGAFSVTVLECLKHRIEYFQTTKFACNDNEEVLSQLDSLILTLNHRQRERYLRGVRGKHEE